MPRQGSPSQSSLTEPRKYTIRSRFGDARQHRSRKSRPCDICRRRKTACIIPVEAPCLFCRSRGLVCESTVGLTATRTVRSTIGSEQLQLIHHEQSPPRILDRFPFPNSSLPPEDFAGPLTRTERQALISPESATLTPNESLRLSQPAFIVPQSNSCTNVPTLSLEDVGNRTSHYMGLAAEQDTHLLDAFRSVIISEKDEVDANIIRVYCGNPQVSEPPVHFLLLENEFPQHTNHAMQTASDAIEAIIHPHGLALVRLFFQYVHPAYPVLSKTRFLRQFSTDRERIPASLRGAVYALACAFWSRDTSLGEPCPFSQYELVGHAQDTLRRELEAPTLYKLQACLLLLHPRPPDIDTVETPNTWILAAQATACAQIIGLHRDPSNWAIAPWEKSLRKRLWWATYVADCWSAVCHGSPPHISSSSFDTPSLDIEDIRFDEDVVDSLLHLVDPSSRYFRISDGVRFLEVIKISRCLRTILDCSSFRVNNGRPSESEARESRDQLVALKQSIEDWPNLIPHCLGVDQCGPFGIHWNAPLHLSFYATQVLMYRALMHPATREAKATPGSNLRRWFSPALDASQAFTGFMGKLTDEDLGSFWVRHARSQLILCGNFLIYLFLLASDPGDVQAAFRLLENFHQTLQRLGATEKVDGRLLLRPIMLRIDSFFTQAADLLKRGGAGSVASPALTI